MKRALKTRRAMICASALGVALALLFAGAPVAFAQQQRQSGKPEPPAIPQRVAPPVLRPITIAPPVVVPAVPGSTGVASPVPAVRPPAAAPPPVPLRTAPPIHVVKPLNAAPVLPVVMGIPAPTAFQSLPTERVVSVGFQQISIGSSGIQLGMNPLIPPGNRPTASSRLIAPLACDPISLLLGSGHVCLAPYVMGLQAANDHSDLWNSQALLAAETYGAFGSVWPSLWVPLCPLCVGPVGGPNRAGIPIGPMTLPGLAWPQEMWNRIAQGSLPGMSTLQTQLQAKQPGGIGPLPPSSVAPRIYTSHVPYIFVLRDGSRDIVSRYWLGEDWLLHYVTVNGQKKTASLDQLNLNATAAANYARGIPFAIPGWPVPTTAH